MREIPELRHHVRRATSAITRRAEREEARAELYEHALSRYEDARAEGLDHAAAVAAALAGLGDPDELSGEFERAHRQPLTPGAVTLLILASVAFLGALLGFVLLLFAYQEATAQIVLAGLGLCLALGLGVVLTTHLRRNR
jgi:hypothetical protein